LLTKKSEPSFVGHAMSAMPAPSDSDATSGMSISFATCTTHVSLISRSNTQRSPSLH
jgi:hypothetical protein